MGGRRDRGYWLMNSPRLFLFAPIFLATATSTTPHPTPPPPPRPPRTPHSPPLHLPASRACTFSPSSSPIPSDSEWESKRSWQALSDHHRANSASAGIRPVTRSLPGTPITSPHLGALGTKLLLLSRGGPLPKILYEEDIPVWNTLEYFRNTWNVFHYRVFQSKWDKMLL